MNKLAVLEKHLPLRAYPEANLNTIISTVFKFWLSNLLSLKADQEDKVNIALPKIKEHCIGMGFNEITKMFEMYADGLLPIKPIPNYFDRILLGKIVAEYKSKTIKPEVMTDKEFSDEEKEFIMIEAVDRLQKEYTQYKRITSACTHVYDYLFEKGKLPKHTKVFRDRIYHRAKQIAKAEVQEEASADYSVHRRMKEMLEKIEQGDSDKIVPISKRLVLEEYYKNIRL